MYLYVEDSLRNYRHRCFLAVPGVMFGFGGMHREDENVPYYRIGDELGTLIVMRQEKRQADGSRALVVGVKLLRDGKLEDVREFEIRERDQSVYVPELKLWLTDTVDVLSWDARKLSR